MTLQNPYAILSKLGLSEAESQVYLAMVSGSVGVKEIMKTTGQKRPTVYYVLQQLITMGLVTKTDSALGSVFRVEPVSRLEVLAQQRLDDSKEAKLATVDLIPLLEKKSRIREKPRVAFFEGKQAIQNVIMESLYCKSKVIRSIAPQNNYFWQVGQDFVEKYVSQRRTRNIKMFNLWEKPIAPKLYEKYYRGIANIRLLPKSMRNSFPTTIFLYDDTVLYIASKESNYCLLVRSDEHYKTMAALFEGLWSASREYSLK